MDTFSLLSGGLNFNPKVNNVSIFKPTIKPLVKKTENPTQTVTSENVGSIRKTNGIKVTGSDVPFPFLGFSDLLSRYSIDSYLYGNLMACGFNSPTPIQMQAIPVMFHGRELMACAPTGSGKTLAFLLSIIYHLKAPAKQGIRALIITPTRELAKQIHREFEKLTQGKGFKACVLSKSTNLDKHSVKIYDLMITTPLRLVYALNQMNLRLDNVTQLVLDEADRLLELGFLEQMDEIFANCTNDSLQKSLYSATIPSGVEQIANSFMKDPIRVVIGVQNSATETIDQELLYVGQESGKLVAIRQLIQQGINPPVLVFVQSIERAKELFRELIYDGLNVDVIHSERTQAQRDNIVDNFRIGKIWVLISTELMSRGIDFKGVSMVINYDFPQSAASYIHRIGRTGRAGRKGKAITYFTKEDAPFVKTVANVMKESGCEISEWILKLKNPTKDMKRNLKKRAVDRDNIEFDSVYDQEQRKKKQKIIESSKKRKSGNAKSNPPSIS